MLVEPKIYKANIHNKHFSVPSISPLFRQRWKWKSKKTFFDPRRDTAAAVPVVPCNFLRTIRLNAHRKYWLLYPKESRLCFRHGACAWRIPNPRDGRISQNRDCFVVCSGTNHYSSLGACLRVRDGWIDVSELTTSAVTDNGTCY